MSQRVVHFYSKRTPEAAAIILDVIERGASKKVAANYAGMSVRTLSRWLKSDPQFDLEIRARQAQNTTENLQIIKDAASEDWKAAQFLVQHSPYSKEEWGNQKNSKVGPTIFLNIQRGKVRPEGHVIDVEPTMVNEHSLPLLDIAGDTQIDEPPLEVGAEIDNTQRECWQGDNVSEKKALSEQQALEERVMGPKKTPNVRIEITQGQGWPLIMSDRCTGTVGLSVRPARWYWSAGVNSIRTIPIVQISPYDLTDQQRNRSCTRHKARQRLR